MRYEPTRPIDEIVVELNRLYHALEARIYDRQHPEIFEQLPGIWRRMIDMGIGALTGDKIDILDFGCGTGFATEQVLAHVPPERLGSVLCYDVSPEMVSVCRAKTAKDHASVAFFSSRREVESRVQALGGVHLIVTNSVLHHLRDWAEQAARFHALLRTGGVWVSGHEPSRRYLQNAECRQASMEYERAMRRRRYLSARWYWSMSRALLGIPGERQLLWKVAQQARHQGLFRRAVHPRIIGALVDYHVPHTPKEAAVRGLAPDIMEVSLEHTFDLLFCETYCFMGKCEGLAPRKWRRRAEILRHKYPRDGKNFCAVWRKKNGQSPGSTGLNDNS